MEKKCTLLFVLLEEEKLFLLDSLDFIRLCLLMDVDAVELNRYLMEELGFSGEQIMLSYKKDFKARLKERYGIVIER